MGLVELEKCRLCGEHRETLQHLLSNNENNGNNGNNYDKNNVNRTPK